MANITFPDFDPRLCTIQTCDLAYATVDYVPSLGGNAFFLAVFALLLCLQLGFGIYYRTWGYMVGLCGGLILETIGYVARIQMHNNPWLSDPFLMYIITLTIAPCFFTGAIYICLRRIIHVYSPEHARFKPKTYTIVFISFDIFSLVLQAAGGALADTASSDNLGRIGIHIMVAGLAFQVFSLTIFVVLCLDFAWRVKKAGIQPSGMVGSAGKLYLFMSMLALATLAIFIRSCYRVAELESGFNGKLANQEVPFMILEGTMITIAATALSIVQPGQVFRENWSSLTKKTAPSSKASSDIEK